MADIPKESELANMRNKWKDLSTVTVNGGKTLILKHNSEIMVPKLEQTNILSIAHQTHLGQKIMVTQLGGKMFWNKMNFDINKLVAECDPCTGKGRDQSC